ncbi:MAG: DUF4389 domain-containing protein [Nanoarchaeota archaeon]
MGKRAETLMRIVVLIVTGIILSIWKIVVQIFFIINFIWTLISGKRIKELAALSEIWNTQWYIFQRYLRFVTNEGPFPFRSLTKSISKFERK